MIRRVKIGHQAPPFAVSVLTTASRPRRPCADAVRSLSSNEANTFAAAGRGRNRFRVIEHTGKREGQLRNAGASLG
jgi:hypothetical protein